MQLRNVQCNRTGLELTSHDLRLAFCKIFLYFLSCVRYKRLEVACSCMHPLNLALISSKQHSETSIQSMRPDTRRATTASVLVLLAAVTQLAATFVHSDLEEEYRFSAVLDDGYTLHWNFDLEQQIIAFAVNVSTTGWVGFGLSPNGQMPQSDVVIGWVDNDGNTQFHVSSPL